MAIYTREMYEAAGKGDAAASKLKTLARHFARVLFSVSGPVVRTAEKLGIEVPQAPYCLRLDGICVGTASWWGDLYYLGYTQEDKVVVEELLVLLHLFLLWGGSVVPCNVLLKASVEGPPAPLGDSVFDFPKEELKRAVRSLLLDDGAGVEVLFASIEKEESLIDPAGLQGFLPGSLLKDLKTFPTGPFRSIPVEFVGQLL